jgi:hypothetical protein
MSEQIIIPVTTNLPGSRWIRIRRNNIYHPTFSPCSGTRSEPSNGQKSGKNPTSLPSIGIHSEPSNGIHSEPSNGQKSGKHSDPVSFPSDGHKLGKNPTSFLSDGTLTRVNSTSSHDGMLTRADSLSNGQNITLSIDGTNDGDRGDVSADMEVEDEWTTITTKKKKKEKPIYYWIVDSHNLYDRRDPSYRLYFVDPDQSELEVMDQSSYMAITKSGSLVSLNSLLKHQGIKMNPTFFIARTVNQIREALSHVSYAVVKIENNEQKLVEDDPFVPSM